MADEQNDDSRLKYWKTMTSLSAMVAVAAIIWGLNEHQRVSELTEQLSQARTSGQSLVNEANSKLQALTKEANTKLQALAKHDLPITVSFRPALLGNGLVAIFKNNSSSQLEIAAAFESPATGQRREANLVIPPNGSQEIGHAEGWPFSKGQHIKLSNENFRSAEYDVP